MEIIKNVYIKYSDLLKYNGCRSLDWEIVKDYPCIGCDYKTDSGEIIYEECCELQDENYYYLKYDGKEIFFGHCNIFNKIIEVVDKEYIEKSNSIKLK